MKGYIVLALLAIATCASYTDKRAFSLFQNFIQKYNKIYPSTEEFMRRFLIFRYNLEHQVNARGDWKQGVTKFFDMHPAEFRAKYLRYKKPTMATAIKARGQIRDDPPEEFNWVDKKVLPEVKDQESCGSCWAFSACANMEGCWNYKHNKTGEKIDRCSEQMLVDCDPYDEGCDGGNMDTADKWVIENGGIMNDQDYPYEGFDDDCHQDKSKLIIKLEKYLTLDSKSEDEMKDWLLKYGPISIGLNADLMQFYDEGIMDPDEDECDPESLDHGVTLVGYSEKGKKPYWIVRNSWGDSWGEDGYFRIVKGKGACGLNQMVSTAVVA